MVKKFVRDNLFFIFIIALCFFAFIALNAVALFWVDDFYWATRSFSWQSITALNGRYLGSVLSLIITKAIALRAIICAALTVILLFVLSLNGARFYSGSRAFYFIAAAALFFIMPASIFVQAEVWASGFANYIPSALIAVTFATLVRREFADEPPEYGRAMPYLAAALGLVGAFFMETVTIGNVIVGAAILIYHCIRFKKSNATLISFLAGALIGAVLMFVNPVYFSIADGNDPSAYRGVRDSFKSIKVCYLRFFQYYFLYDNFALNVIITGLFIWLAVKRLPFLNWIESAAIIACFLIQAVFLTLSGSTFVGCDLLPEGTPYANEIKGLFTALFAASMLAESLLLIKNINVKLNLIFLMGASLAYSLPLLVVTPITARAFVAVYLLFIIFAIILLNENLGDCKESCKRLTVILGFVFGAVTLAAGIFYMVSYARIYSAYNNRAESIAAQLSSGAEQIVVEELDVSGYIFNREIPFAYFADPIPGGDDVFKLYYGIPQDTVLSVITPQ